MNAVSRYFAVLSDRFGQGWNRFWFLPQDPYALCGLRIAIGLLAIYYHLSFLPDLVTWFGPQGLLPVETVQPIMEPGAHRYSYLFLLETPGALWTAHVLGLVVLVMFTCGVFSRLSNILSAIVLLSYVHRAPMLIGLFEPVLTMALLYLCIAPTGTYLSVDRWWYERRAAKPSRGWRFAQGLPPAVAAPGTALPARSFTATISQRLLQLHVALFYLIMGLTKLGAETWWVGDAMWWLAARTESRLVDFSWLASSTLLINAWTHFVVVFELAFAVLIWNRLARPLLLGLACLHWPLLALVTGQIGFCLMMLVVSFVFVTPSAIRRWRGEEDASGYAARAAGKTSAVTTAAR